MCSLRTAFIAIVESKNRLEICFCAEYTSSERMHVLFDSLCCLGTFLKARLKQRGGPKRACYALRHTCICASPLSPAYAENHRVYGDCSCGLGCACGPMGRAFARD